MTLTKQIADTILNEFFLSGTNNEIAEGGYLNFLLARMKHHNVQPSDMGDLFAEWRADKDPIRNLISGNVYQILVEDMGRQYLEKKDPELRKIMVGIALSLTIDTRQAFPTGATSGVEFTQ